MSILALPKLDLVVPRLLPDETLYSLCARAHAVSGFTSARSTSRALLGHDRGAVHHGVPFGLGRLEYCSDGRIHPSEQLLRSCTVLGSYFPLMTASERLSVLRSCIDSAPGVARTVRIRHSWQISRAHELRLCESCFCEDVLANGHGYWRASHQLPGVWACVKHRQWLSYVPKRSSKANRWLTADHATPLLEKTKGCSQSLQIALNVADAATWLTSLNTANPRVLASMVRSRLMSTGVLRSELTISRAELATIEGRVNLLPDATFAELRRPGWIRQTLIDARMAHPIRWAVLLALCDEHLSTNLACEYFIAAQRLPNLELFNARSATRKSSAPLALYDLLAGPIQLKDAAEKSGLAISQLRSWIRKDPALARHWKEKRIEVRNRAARFTLQGFRKEHPAATRMEAIRACLWAVRQLEHYDSEGLSLLPQPIVRVNQQFDLFDKQKSKNK